MILLVLASIVGLLFTVRAHNYFYPLAKPAGRHRELCGYLYVQSSECLHS